MEARALIETYRRHVFVLLVWAFAIAVLTILALLPWLLGLLVILPVLGHASWHIYRRVLYDPV